MLTAEEARKQGKSKIKEWVVNDLDYLEGEVIEAIEEKDETFTSVDLKHLHKEALGEVTKALKELGYRTFLSEKNLVLQWGAEDKKADPAKDEVVDADFEEVDDDPYDENEDSSPSWDDDI